MLVRVVANGSRAYIVDTAAKEIAQIIGQGRGPSVDKAEFIIREAIRAAGSGLKEIALTDATEMPRVPRAVTISRSAPVPTTENLTDDQRLENMAERYQMFQDIAVGMTHGDFPAVIVSGGPGQGKSSTVIKVMKKAAEERGIVGEIIQGSTLSPITLYETLYKYRHRGNVLWLDDSDSVLSNSQSALLLKSALDSKDERTMSWGTRATLSGDTPYKFTYYGSFGMLSNQNFRHIVNSGNQLSERVQHLGAIISRVSYLDLMMHNIQDRWLWTLTQIKMHRILEGKGLKPHEQTAVLEFMHANLERLQEVSIRTAVKIVPYVQMARRTEKDWRKAAAMMEFK